MTQAPLTEELKEILRGYNRNNITRYATLMERLAEDHGYKIGCVSGWLSLSFIDLIQWLQTKHAIQVSQGNRCREFTKKTHTKCCGDTAYS